MTFLRAKSDVKIQHSDKLLLKYVIIPKKLVIIC